MVSHTIKSRIALIFCALLLVVAGVLGFGLWSMDNAGNPSPNPNNKAVQVDPYGFPEVDWNYWCGVNPDVIGWVTVPGTNIDSPIVQAHESDPEYYLSHDVFKNYNVFGCPYLDSECELLGFDSPNAVIFGHHMDNGTVFSAFADFTSTAFAQEHNKILLQTPSSKQILTVHFSKMINAASDTSKRCDFSNQVSYEKWYKESLSDADVVLDASVPDKNTTFVTCSYNRFKNERTLVFAAK